MLPPRGLLCFAAVSASVMASSPNGTGVPPTSLWAAPPGPAVSNGMPLTAPLLGNGDLGVALLGNASLLSYHAGLNQFWAFRNYTYPRSPEPPYPRVVGIGQLDLKTPSPFGLSDVNSRYEMDTKQAEVRTSIPRPGCPASVPGGVQQLHSTAFVAPHQNALLLRLSLDIPSDGAPPSCGTMPITAGVATLDGNPNSPADAGVNVSGMVWASRVAVTESSYPVKAGMALGAFRLDGARMVNLTATAAGARVEMGFTLAAGTAGSIALVLQVRTNRDLPGPAAQDPDAAVPAALAALPKADGTAPRAFYDSMLAERDAQWTEFWSRSSISLPADGLIERFWYGSQYLRGCAARANKAAPGLWGPWVFGDAANWHGDFTLNYNYEATFYGAASSNQLDVSAAQFAPYLEQVPNGRRDAAFYNCSAGGAIHFTGHIAPHGYHGSLGPAPYGDMRQHSDASFAALGFLTHWEYTRNNTWLRSTAFPFVTAVAAWWECWLQRDNSSATARASRDGYRFVDPSDCNNEGCGGNPSNFNPIISITFIRRLFTVLQEMAAALGGPGAPGVPDAARLALWADIATHVAEPQAVHREWPYNGSVWVFSESPNPKVPKAGQNPINLYPIFPAELVSLSSTGTVGGNTTTLTLATGVASVLQMGSYSQGNAFMEIFPAGVRVAAPGIVERLREQLAARMGDNFVVSEGGGGLEVFGATEAVNSMLLTSHEGFLRLFPLVPRGDAPASFRSLRARGAFLVDAAYNPSDSLGVTGVVVRSEAGLSCAVRNPWPNLARPVVVDTATGARVAVTWVDAATFRFDTVAGGAYNITV
eukprot:Hpha_TRINITY_DN30150_c0_g1::TRINITY_DN30150_c0_g1_i1::g.110591::m.110591